MERHARNILRVFFVQEIVNYINNMNTKPFYTSSLSDTELLSIFPEAKEIIPEKIQEYEADRKNLITRMKVFHNAINNIADTEQKDKFFIWFWHSYLKYFYAPAVVQIDKHLSRLYRQNRIFYKSDNNYSTIEAKWAEQKERAKNQSLHDIALPQLEKARQVGNRITACCPFHDDRTPSFTIYINQNTYHCFGCQAHGNVITFKMKIDNLSFKEAVKELAK